MPEIKKRQNEHAPGTLMSTWINKAAGLPASETEDAKVTGVLPVRKTLKELAKLYEGEEGTPLL